MEQNHCEPSLYIRVLLHTAVWRNEVRWRVPGLRFENCTVRGIDSVWTLKTVQSIR